MIFSPEQMWQCAVKQMGLVDYGHDSTNGLPLDAIVLLTPEDVAELYKALQEAHWVAVADYERKL